MARSRRRNVENKHDEDVHWTDQEIEENLEFPEPGGLMKWTNT